MKLDKSELERDISIQYFLKGWLKTLDKEIKTEDRDLQNTGHNNWNNITKTRIIDPII